MDHIISAAIAIVVSGIGVIGSHLLYTKVWIATTNERIKNLEKLATDHSESMKEYISTSVKVSVLEEKFNHLSNSIDRLNTAIDKLADKIDKIPNR